MRQLIKNLRKEKTIIISTHILTEAKEICDDIIIINKGKLSARGDTHSLLSAENGQKIIIIIEKSVNPENVKQKLSALGTCSYSETQNNYKFTLESRRNGDLRKEVFDFIIRNKIPALEFRKETVSLEELFRQLTL
jgi:ABC-2 type transport system ATP-binding protein